MTDALTKRVEALEMRIAHQDRTIEELSDVVRSQQVELDAVNGRFARLLDRVQSVEADLPEPDNRPPPHY